MAELVLRGLLPAQAGGAAAVTTIVGEVPKTFAQTEYQLQRISITSPTVLTGTNTHFVTIAVRGIHAGTAYTNALVSKDFTSGVNLAVEVPFELLNNTATQVTIPAGDVIDVTLTQNDGTGLAWPIGVVVAVELA